MSFSERRAWLICYDIPCPRRLQRVHAYLLKSALWVQYSAFAAFLSERQINGVLQGLSSRIDPAEDDIRVYPLPAQCEVVLLGASPLPRGVILPDQQFINLLVHRPA